MLLYVDQEGRLARIEGDPLSPFNNGKLCMRCLDMVEAVNHPDRLKYPLRRAGKRGENRWERITWDEAYDEIVELSLIHISFDQRRGKTVMDAAKIEAGVRLILEGVGEDPEREGLSETPARVARMYEEVFAGLEQDPAEHFLSLIHI